MFLTICLILACGILIAYISNKYEARIREAEAAEPVNPFDLAAMCMCVMVAEGGPETRKEFIAPGLTLTEQGNKSVAGVAVMITKTLTQHGVPILTFEKAKAKHEQS